MIITTIKEKCRQCYACVRNCPVKAVKIAKGQAEIIESRCIQCGNCLKVCSQQAKKVLDCREQVKEMLRGREPVAIILAPSFAASFQLEKPLSIVTALKGLGFAEVWNASLGAQLIIPEYEKLIAEQEMTISSPCPAVIGLLEKHFPALLKYLAPIVSPMVATARYIKSLDPHIKLVFAGPCTAKKGEIQEFADLITYCLTFWELKSLLKEKGIAPEECSEERFSGPVPFNGQLIPISGGLASMLKVKDILLNTEFLVVDGQKECLNTLEALEEGRLKGKFIDMLMCRGCIDGPSIDTPVDYHLGKKAVIEFFKEIPLNQRLQGKEDISKITGVDLGREFKVKKETIKWPGENELRAILANTGKLTENDEINCGACGYNSCREKALAVYQGIAEVEMCLPYLLDKKTKLLEQLNGENKKIKELNHELDTFVDASYDGICVTDEKGFIIKNNKAFNELYDLQEVVGTYVGELEEKNLATPSVTLLVLKEKRPVTLVQKIHNGRKLLVTGTPIFNDEGLLTHILINSRDLEELEKMKIKFDRNLEERDRSGNNMGTEKIIAYSQEMGSILETCRKIARVDSTVLITGESGVGKEAVARYIHSSSQRKDAPWVKVNCGAIPENLMESELFGYESGAFTGAKREGKIGLFEMAHKGTIFLDEMGDLPQNLQVKLLQVLQEKCLIRIGGMRPIQIDCRIIAATNRDLEEMVKKEKFRQDLYYRLNVVPIHVPPLRSRRDDIIPLTNYFLDFFNNKYGTVKKISREVTHIFLGYDWPGNIRELMNLTERLVVTTDSTYIEAAALPLYLVQGTIPYTLEGVPRLQEALDQMEKEILTRAYKIYNNSYKMAAALGVNQSTIIRKMKKYGITMT